MEIEFRLFEKNFFFRKKDARAGTVINRDCWCCVYDGSWIINIESLLQPAAYETEKWQKVQLNYPWLMIYHRAEQ